MNVRTLLFSLTLAGTMICSAQDQTQPKSADTAGAQNQDDAIRANLTDQKDQKSAGEITLSDAPPAVQKNIQRQAAAMPLKTLTRSMQNGMPVYTALFVGKNAKTEIQYNENGTALGMHIVSAAPVVYHDNGAQTAAARTAGTQPEANVTATTTTTTVQPQTTETVSTAPTTALPRPAATSQAPLTSSQANVPGATPTATETTVPQGAVVQTTGPIPNVPSTRNAGQMPTPENPPIQFEAAGAEAPARNQLPAQIGNTVQQQLGSMTIESSRPITIYQINARDQSGQTQTFFVDENGRLIQ